MLVFVLVFVSFELEFLLKFFLFPFKIKVKETITKIIQTKTDIIMIFFFFPIILPPIIKINTKEKNKQ